MRRPFNSLVVFNITEEKEEHKYLTSGERPENIGFLEQELYNKNVNNNYYISKFNKLSGYQQFFNQALDNWKIKYKSNIKNILKNESYQEYIELEHDSLSIKLHVKLKYFCEHLTNLIIENGIIKNKILFLYDKEDLFIAPEGTLEYVNTLKFIAGANEVRMPKPGDVVSSSTYDYSKMIYLGKAYKTDCHYLGWFYFAGFFKEKDKFDNRLNMMANGTEMFNTTTKAKHIFACLKGNKVEFNYVSTLKKMSILDSVNLDNFKFEDITIDLDKEEVFIPILNWIIKIYTYAPYSYISNSVFHTEPKPTKKQLNSLLNNRKIFYTDKKFDFAFIKHDRSLIQYKNNIDDLKTYTLNFLDKNLNKPKERNFSQLRGLVGQLIKEG